ncbi:GlcNAc-PI de-N-acetylase [Solemya pervernicosa gill symbiont]|uniref:GlcNAc-PI de-N-acetylase n=1 Tax=Solemya pervernicosa gill symbiont TaxID=642797 RepID=A0A1T2LA59_9GAMM|nr:PIG-L deacetylase family protein [Solemya pervernicosa gill symbiont]OOZ41826.1 GlcNAc-PI de-N-acetylase [Solemya pervernicosa gill symbiont]
MTVLVVAAHPDDEVLGCGGTIARHTANGEHVVLLLLGNGLASRDDGNNKINECELSALRSATDAAADVLGISKIFRIPFPDNRMDEIARLDVVKAVESIVQTVLPSTVYTHFEHDVNVDHSVTYNAVLTACRPQPEHSVDLLLSFEVPSSTEWRFGLPSEKFSPNWFVDISDTIDAKMRALHCYKEEMRAYPHPRSVKAVESLASWRGATVGVNAAEAFQLRRMIIK